MKKLTAPFLALVAAAAMAFTLCSSFNAGVAHAQAADAGSAIGSGSAAISTPVLDAAPSTPDVSLSAMEKLYKSGAFFCLGIVVLFVGLRFADSKIAWLQQGKNATYTAAALGGLALLVLPASQGTTPNMGMLGSAIATAIGLIINPTKTATT